MKNVAVTGGTGFIGGRLVEKLILEHDSNVRVLIRDFAKAPRIARFKLEMIGGSAADAGAVRQLVEGCDVVFHCAHNFSNAQENMVAARNIADACLEAGVQRFVHVSTFSVYEPLDDGDLDENSVAKASASDYSINKKAIEQLLLNYHVQQGLPVAIVQPTIVYGPFAGTWTHTPIRNLRASRVALPVNGTAGLCNAVYVDDVADGMILAATTKRAVGERFLISGPEPVSWPEFFNAYIRMLGSGSILQLPKDEIRQLRDGIDLSTRQKYRRDAQETIGSLLPKPVKRWIRRVIGTGKWEKIKKSFPPQTIFPSDQLIALYSAKAHVRIDKARKLLGYAPKVDFPTGMRLTAEYVRWANL